MSKKEWKGEGVIVLTLDQAKAALVCAYICKDHRSDDPEYSDASRQVFHLKRTELMQRLRTALRAHGEEV